MLECMDYQHLTKVSLVFFSQRRSGVDIGFRIVLLALLNSNCPTLHKNHPETKNIRSCPKVSKLSPTPYASTRGMPTRGPFTTLPSLFPRLTSDGTNSNTKLQRPDGSMARNILMTTMGLSLTANPHPMRRMCLLV